MTKHHGTLSATAALHLFGCHRARHIGQRVTYTLYPTGEDGHQFARDIWDAHGRRIGGCKMIGPNGIIPIDPRTK